MKYFATAIFAAVAACALAPAMATDFKDFVPAQTTATTPGASDYIPLIQGGATKKLPGNSYAPPTSGGAILKGNSLGGFANAVGGADYAPPPSGSANTPLFNNGSGGFTNGTRSGNTTTVVTKDASAPATGECAKWDANGNLTTAGAACGAGGTSTNGSLGDVLRSDGAGGFGTPLTLGSGVAPFLASPVAGIPATWLQAGAAVANLTFTPANSTITVTGTGLIAGGGNLTANRTLNLAAIAANSLIMNNTGSSAVPTVAAIPACPDSGGQHLNYGSGVFSCGTSGSGGGGGALSVTDTSTTVPSTTILTFDPKNFIVSTPTGGSANVALTYTVGTDRSGADYTVLTGDSATTLPVGVHAYTLAQAGSAGFAAGYSFCMQNVATAGNATVTTSTSVFKGAGGLNTMLLEAGGWACFASSGGDWYTQVGHYNAMPGAVYLTGSLSPTALSGAVNDYNPAGLSGASALFIDGGASARNITGLAGGADGRILTITNNGATQNLTLVNASASSSASNRFDLSGDTVLPPKTSVALRYDSSSSRWRPFTRALSNTAVTAGVYTCADVTVGTDGRLTSAASGSCTGSAVVNVAYATLGWIPTVDPSENVIFTATTATTIVGLRGTVVAGAGATATVQVNKAPNGTACIGGTNQASTTFSFDANGTANTNQTLTLAGGAANVLAAGDRLCFLTSNSANWIAGTAKGDITAAYTTP